MQIIVGTSGWLYKDWNGRFYPKDVKDQFAYYVTQFPSVEINSTFYQMARKSLAENRAKVAPRDFRFSIKLNRYLTHAKKLKPDNDFDEALRNFLENLTPLGNKLAAILVQLPPSLRQENDRLEHLVKEVQKHEKSLKMKFPLAIEFRHESWFNENTYGIMRRYNLANVINDSPDRWPASRAITADFAYIRFHGNKEIYRSSYTDAELEKWIEFIDKECQNCESVFCYFNNDYNAVAVNNAKALIKKIPRQYRDRE